METFETFANNTDNFEEIEFSGCAEEAFMARLETGSIPSEMDQAIEQYIDGGGGWL